MKMGNNLLIYHCKTVQLVMCQMTNKGGQEIWEYY
jgi:hypothetical protein